MIKTLILCKKSETSKLLINHVISKIYLLQLVGIANSREEALNLLEEITPNLIISTDKEIVLLIRQHFKHYTPKIILLSRSMRELPYFYKDSLIIPYNLSFELMVERIKNYLNDYLKLSKKEQLRKILKEIGFNLNLSGTIYLIDCILYANSFRSPGSSEKLEKDIYSYVAQKNNTTIQKVKWSIERAIRYMHESHTKDTYKHVEEYLAVEYPQKPTPKLVINTLSDIITL